VKLTGKMFSNLKSSVITQINVNIFTMNDLEKRIFELINEASEEDTPSTETVDVEQTTDTNQETGTEDKSDVEEETTFTAESFDDFLKKTDTKVKITKVSTEPSPIFGP